MGAAAAFRAQWAREAGTVTPAREVPPSPILLRTDQAPGDAVAITAAIYSLHRAHPGRYLTAVESRWPEVFAYNPDVVPAESIPNAAPLQMHYPAIHQSNQRGIHFMQGWCEHLSAALGAQVPLLTNRPRLYFANQVPRTEDYWVVCSGGKRDFTNKLWGHHNYQTVVDLLENHTTFLQVGRAEDDHPTLEGPSVSIVYNTALRDLFELVRRARGVLCGVSLLMHVAAALEKPCIVVAGGREPVQWNAYPKQHYLHTVGALPCSSPQGETGGACWRSRVVPLGDGTELDKNTCERPVGNVPECMTLIKPETVADLILRYNKCV
jgi:ADP-heptose:LPS heptosyltransferase